MEPLFPVIIAVLAERLINVGDVETVMGSMGLAKPSKDVERKMPNFWIRERIGCATLKVVRFDTIHEMIVSSSIVTSRESLPFWTYFRVITSHISMTRTDDGSARRHTTTACTAEIVPFSLVG
jgi:hypothetical protein